MSGEGLQFFATNRAMETLSGIVEHTAAGEKSGKAARDQRLRLQSGGYYFIDADEYLSDFLAQVDSETMPERAIVTESRKTVFEDFLSNPAIGRVVVCVHGFNVSLHNAITWYRILTDTMRHQGFGNAMTMRADDSRLKEAKPGSVTAFVGFSWPSNGSMFAYNRDQADAVASGQAFVNLLMRLRVHGKRVSLLCHSMGNYMACNALAGLVNKVFLPNAMTAEYIKTQFPDMKEADAMALELKLRMEISRGRDKGRQEPFLIDEYVMIAPDVERRHVTKSRDEATKRSYVGPFFSGLEHVVRNVVNVYSRFDGALAISSVEKKPKDWALKVGDALAAISPWGILDDLKRDPDNKWEMRLGSSAHPITAPPNMTSINATEIAGRPIDHSDHIDSAELAIAIAEALGLKRAP
jgi:esterase/lipase superfamily enzyme